MTNRQPVALVVGEFGTGALALSYARALEGLGWRTVRYDAGQGYTRRGLLANARLLRRVLRRPLWALMVRETLALARREPYDLAVCVKAPFLDRVGVQALKRTTRAPVVMIYPDSPYEAYTQRADARDVLANFDRVYIWGRHLVEPLRADGVAATYLPFGFDPVDYGPEGRGASGECGRRHAIVFVGQYHDKRAAWLAALEGLDVGIWGIGWEVSRANRIARFCRHRASIRGAAAAEIYRTATVAINVLNPQNVPAHNMRTFEIPPCRTVMLTEATVEIAGFFEPDRACLTADDPAGLRAQAQRALADPALARSVADEGARAAHPHTYQARCRTILADLGVGAARAVAAGAAT